jgi:hypothetical protein
MRRGFLMLVILIVVLGSAFLALAGIKYVKVASFKDIGQSRAFFIAFKEEVPSAQLEDGLWEIVDYHMNKYGQAPQMWIYFFDDKKYAPKDFPIEGTSLEHLVAQYFYATDTRKKDLQILTEQQKNAIIAKGRIESPLWEGQ